jgi:hypothetical protein
MATAGGNAANATYRKLNAKLAKTLSAPVKHSKYPSDDFNDLLMQIDAKSRARALRLYKKGIRLGFDRATTDVVNGKLRFDGQQLFCPAKVNIRVNLTLHGTIAEKNFYIHGW